MNILDFPCNLLLEIFSYLDKITIIGSVRKVCQSFRRLTFDRSLWKTLTTKQFPLRTKFTTKSFLELLTGVQNSVQCLHLDMDELDDIGMLHEGIKCSNLKELYIYTPFDEREDNGIDDLEQLIEESEEWEHIINLKKYLSSFCEKYPYLKALHLRSGDLNVAYLSDKFVNLETFSISEGTLQDSCIDFFENHPSIKHLSLKNCAIESSAVPIVLSQLPNLETFDFSGTVDFFDSWDDEANVVKHDKLDGLRELCIDDKRDEFLSQICNKMPELRKLSIIGSWVKDKELIEIAKHCPKLETVLLNATPWTTCYTTNEALCAIAASCTQLQVLHTNYCDEIDSIGIQHIIESCPSLCDLGIARCTTLTDDHIFSLVDNCPRIQKLNLRECTGLTSKSVSAILKGCRSITDLDLQGCYKLVDIRITDDSAPTIMPTKEDLEIETVETDKLGKEMIKLDEETKDYQHPVKIHSHVRTLKLQSCVNLRDKCLEQISSFCPDLRDVDLDHCSSITNQGVTALVQNCTLLEKLNLTCRSMNTPSKLSDECLLSITKNCKNLRVLIIVTNIHITADGIFNVIQNCPSIEHIEPSHGARLSLDIAKLKMLVGTVIGKVVRIEDKHDLNIYIHRNHL